MSPGQFADVIEWLEDAWPGTRNFRHAEKLAATFTAIPEKAVWEAARNHYNAGNKTAPSLSELRTAAADLARQQGLTDPNASNCQTRGRHGPRAIDTLRDRHGKPKTDDKGNILREAMCVDCGDTLIKPAHQLLTEGERAEQAEKGTLPPAPDDVISDRIAP